MKRIMQKLNGMDLNSSEILLKQKNILYLYCRYCKYKLFYVSTF